MSILEKIVGYKRKEVAVKKQALPLRILEQTAHFNRKCYSMSTAIRTSKSGIIAEHKRRSPSKSVINDSLELPAVASGYQKAGVAGISVLTDTPFFGGSLDDLLLAREVLEIPLLRKDFIIDRYQVAEAKAFGADVILLIAACLDHNELLELSEYASSLSMEVLLEIHNLEELDKSPLNFVQLIGVNNRNLKTFEVSLENSITLSSKIPDGVVKISESGISNPNSIKQLREHGFQGFLIGENFMKSEDPGKSAKEFISRI